MNRSLRLLLFLFPALVLTACDFVESLAPPPDPQEAALTRTAFDATLNALLTAEGPTSTPSPTFTTAPTASATPTVTPPPTSTPNLTATAIAAKCAGDLEALKNCLNESAVNAIMPEAEPDHRLVDNADPSTLYNRPEVLEILNQPETVLRHNVYTRPESCPIAAACVLQTLLISFVSPPAAQQFFDLVTGEGAGLPNETLVDVPSGPAWDDAKCAQGTRPASQAGAPDFAVIYCSVGLGNLHWGFNLSAYESLPEGVVDVAIGALLSQAHDYLAVWQANTGPLDVRWLVGLGNGDLAQAQVVQQVVANFNTRNPSVTLVTDVVDSSDVMDTLAGQIASGNPPDLVGPIGLTGAGALQGEWLDLTPLLAATNYDLGQFPDELLELYQLDGQGQTGLPFAVFPSALYYNRDLFDEAGLDYPPHAYGDPYVRPDGTESAWNFDTVREVALLLTVDANGNNATDPDFDPSAIVQFGYEPQFQDLRAMGSYFGAGSLAGADGQTAVIPEPWTAAWHWIYDGVWADHFIPSQAVRSGAPFSSDSFNSGNVAMALTHLGYTCCLTSAGNWDLAAVPSHNGQVTANVDAGTFFILKSTRHPDEAFQVLTYLVGEAAPALLPLYGGLPARTADQEAFVAGLNAQFPQAVDWQVALDSLAYADHPSYAGYLPNYTAALTRLDGFRNLLFATEGVNLDVEIEALQADLQQVFDQD